MPPKINISKKDQRNLVKFYENSTIRKTSKAFNISRPACKRVLIDNGVEIKSKKQCIRRHKLDIDFFKDINTEKKAYWLGFILADGSVTRTKLGIQLQISDVEHLDKFKFDINSQAPVRKPFRKDKNGNIYQYGCFEVCSVDMMQDLVNIGIYPNKSLNVKHINLDNKLINHYWRGIFDGDGWLSLYKNEYNIGICGSKSVAQAAMRYFKNISNSKSIVHKKGKIYCYQVGGNNKVEEIIKALYKNKTVCLDRKYKKAKLLCNQIK